MYLIKWDTKRWKTKKSFFLDALTLSVSSVVVLTIVSFQFKLCIAISFCDVRVAFFNFKLLMHYYTINTTVTVLFTRTLLK